ncbi:hypothetical protein E2C01_036535 [Portunus trituberculatus]|uniref:Uncharacterized protein n=1 Tax=Portunus trituberculatus TaxID=210409 RepID=A0A5B7F8Y8_PORTR|nr:hypothetical protein [Portunus trituberculatus]
MPGRGRVTDLPLVRESRHLQVVKSRASTCLVDGGKRGTAAGSRMPWKQRMLNKDKETAVKVLKKPRCWKVGGRGNVINDR